MYAFLVTIYNPYQASAVLFLLEVSDIHSYSSSPFI